jgi:general secretion pathway protein G
LRWQAFTLIELLVVMAIIATLVSIAAPRYFRSIEHSKEVALKQNLVAMREAIDRFHGDMGLYPESLEMLVEKRYLKGIPVDPITETAASWQVVATSDPKMGKVYDVKSGADGQASDGSNYREW